MWLNVISTLKLQSWSWSSWKCKSKHVFKNNWLLFLKRM